MVHHQSRRLSAVVATEITENHLAIFSDYQPCALSFSAVLADFQLKSPVGDFS